MEETQLPLRTQSDTHTSFTPRKLKMEWRKLNFLFELKVTLTHLKLKMEWRKLNFPFELKVTLTHLLHLENSKWNGGNSTSLRTQSDIYTEKTQNGMEETQLPFRTPK